jgi:hypothetical protein
MKSMDKREVKKIEAQYHITKFFESIEKMNQKDILELSQVLTQVNDEKLHFLLIKSFPRLFSNNITSDFKNNEPFYNLKLDVIISQLHSELNRASSEEYISSIEWLVEVLLLSPKLFETDRELDNFLSNMTNILIVETDSADRNSMIKDYFNNIDKLDAKKKNEIIYRIAKNLLISNNTTNYKEWKTILYKEKPNK